MRKYIFIILLSIFVLNAFGQEKQILVYDLLNKSIDTLPLIEYDTSKLFDKTNHNIGSFNSNIEDLELTPPTSNTFKGSNFTRKKQASLDYDLTKYPLRTSVKLGRIENDSIKNNCSGSLISRKHVLTAAHCVADFNTKQIIFDTIKVYPVFDNGLPNPNFNSSMVTKIYWFKDWSFNGYDFAILELEEAIGETTGWLSIGFNNNDTALMKGIFYKFSYPAVTVPQIDSNTYNGDTLYYNYGEADLVNNWWLGIKGCIGIPGESGSSIIKIEQGKQYISYGVLSFAVHLKHTKFGRWQFYAIKNIIENDLTDVNPQNIPNSFNLYPNPVQNKLNIKDYNGVQTVFIKNVQGKLITTYHGNNQSHLQLDLEELPLGIYILESGNFVRKFVKIM